MLVFNSKFLKSAVQRKYFYLNKEIFRQLIIKVFLLKMIL